MPLDPLGSIASPVPARDGTPIRVRRWVAPGRPHTYLVLVPDLHEDTSGWEQWARVLQDRGVDIEGFDLRGRGGSGGQLIWMALTDDLEERIAIARSRAGPQPVVVLGHGIGALLALDQALSGRQQVDGLLVLAPSFRLPQRDGFEEPRSGFLASVRGRFRPPQGFAGEVRSAASRVLERGASIGPPVSVMLTRDELPPPPAIHRMRWSVSSTQTAGHDLHRGDGWEHRLLDIQQWLFRRAREHAPATTTAPTSQTMNADLPRKEARALFRAYVASEPERLAAFESAVVDGGGPMPACGRVELVALGAWLIDALQEGEQTGPEPRWSAQWRSWHGPESRLDTPTMWLIDGLVTHLMRCYRPYVPHLEWELDTAKYGDYQEPVFGNVAPPEPVRAVIRAARADPPDRAWLGTIWDRMLTAADHQTKALATDSAGDGILPLDEVRVSPHEDGDHDVLVWIPEQTELAIGEEAFATLDRRIAALPGVARIAWEDREVMYADLAEGATPDGLREAIVGLLAADVEAHRASEANDDG